jgi:hypothetical protein
MLREPASVADGPDHCVAFHVRRGQLFVEYGLSHKTRALMLAHHPGARLVLRIASVRLNDRRSAEALEPRDVWLTSARGKLVFEVDAHAVSRVAVGFVLPDDATFRPLVHSALIEGVGTESVSRWTPEGPIPFVLPQALVGEALTLAR